MRALAPADVAAAARALLRLPAAARAAAMARMIVEADAADRFRKRTARAHPLWGNGTLEAAARARPLAAPQSLSDADYLDCLSVALAALIDRRRAGGGRRAAASTQGE